MTEIIEHSEVSKTDEHGWRWCPVCRMYTPLDAAGGCVDVAGHAVMLGHESDDATDPAVVKAVAKAKAKKLKKLSKSRGNGRNCKSLLAILFDEHVSN